MLEQALDVDASEREVWLAGLDVAERLKSSLRALLAQRHAIESNDFLGSLPVVDEGAPGTVNGGRQAGAQVGPWRLMHEIGHGGMSTVWLAERSDAQVQRQVALKLPHAGPGQEGLTARLLRERDILAALEHRNIARLYDVGVDAAGTPYLVMEHVQGTDLITHANLHRLTILDRLALFQQVLRAVQYAHGKLVLHRDLKPGNILVNEAGDVKLLDFGIAKVLAAERAGANLTDLTRAAGRQLTLAYASPEQILGESLGTASDVYSLGVVLFELLTGERPYKPARNSPGAMEEAVLADEPRRPSQAWVGRPHAEAFGSSAKAVQRALTGDLDVIVLTALQKSPAQRYATVDAMALDLRRHVAGEAILARPTGPWMRLRKFVRRHAAAVGAGLAVVSALAIGMSAAVWQARKAQEEAARATAIKTFLVTLLRGNDLDSEDKLAHRQVTLQTVLEQSADGLAHSLSGQPEVRDELQGLIAELLDNLGLLETAIPLRQQHAQDLAARGAPVPLQVRALRDLADSQASQLAQSRSTLEQAWSLCQAAPAQLDTPECLLARLELGRNILSTGDLAHGSEHVEIAASALRQSPVLSLDRAIAARTLGELRTLQGRFDEADALQQRALSDFEAIWGPQSTRLAMELRLSANQLALQRRYADAIRVYDKAWRIRVQAAGSDAIGSAKLELEMGRLQFRVGLDPQGEQHVLHAGRVMLDSQGPERARMVFNARRARAEVLLYSGRLAAAATAMDELDTAVPDHALNASEAHDLDVLKAAYLTRTGQFAAALRLLEHRRELMRQQQAAEAADVLQLDGRRIDTLVAAGDLGAAVAIAREHGQAVPDEVLLARGDVDAAWPGVQARHLQMQQRPRADQYQFNVVKAHEAMGMALAGRGQHRQALLHFEKAIAELAGGYAHNPALAALRARLALSLLALHAHHEARAQVALAEQALRAEPLAGPQFRRTVQMARQHLNAARKKV